MYKKRLVSLLTALAVFLCFSLTAAADFQADTLYISNAEELYLLRTSSGENFVLTADIDLGGAIWESIPSFYGSFDGGGHTISNFIVSGVQDCENLGFFASANGEIKNLTLKDAAVFYLSLDREGAAPFSVGSIGMLTGTLNGSVSGCQIDNCMIFVKNNSARAYLNDPDSFPDFSDTTVGMIAGTLCGEVINSSVSGSIEAFSASLLSGGIAGSFEGEDADRIKACSSSAVINAEVCMSGQLRVGGICGNPYKYADRLDGSFISDCFFDGSIDAARHVPEGYTTSATSYVGGIAGISSSVIDNCRTENASLTLDAFRHGDIGGICGRNSAPVTGCASSAKITLRNSVAGASYAGGIAGFVGHSSSAGNPLSEEEFSILGESRIKNCVFEEGGSITVSAVGNSSNTANIGGIAGVAAPLSGIYDCASHVSDIDLSQCNSPFYFGGICGYLQGADIVRCEAYGTIENNLQYAQNIYLGGICGTASTTYATYLAKDDAVRYYGPVISDCVSHLNLEFSAKKSSYVGGIAAYIYGANIGYDCQPTVKNCASAGDIRINSIGATSMVGGAIGYLCDGIVENSYSSGSVIADIPSDLALYLGGFAGRVKRNNTDDASSESISRITNCFAYAAPSRAGLENCTKTTIGSFTSEISGNKNGVMPILESCFSPESELGVGGAIESGAEELSSEQFKLTTSFGEWDFEKIWSMSEEHPILRHETTCAYEWNFETENSVPTKIISVIVASPKKGSKLFIKVNDLLTKTDKYYVRDINSGSAPSFAEVECDISLPVLCGDITAYVWDGNLAPLSEPQTY